LVKEEEVLEVLKSVRVPELKSVTVPELKSDVVSLGMIKDLAVKDGKVSFTLVLVTANRATNSSIEDKVRKATLSVPGVSDVEVKVSAKVPSSRENWRSNILPGVKNVVAVASGKGGVGKSTVAANLAVALADGGAATGILDADIYGPNIPRILKVDEKPSYREGRIVPAKAYNVEVMSLGLFVMDAAAMVWRGPMVSAAIRQFITDVDWGELEYLIVDLPPGTGDASLTIAQDFSINGVVIVTTPQDAALGIATKALQMFRQLNVNIVGLVENMSYYVCPGCGHRDEIFGHGGGRRASEEFGVPFLGEIPLLPEIRTGADQGKPIVKDEGSSAAEPFKTIASNVKAQMTSPAFKEAAGAQGTEQKKRYWFPKF